MPAVAGLPEGLSAAAFAATFRDTQSPTYRRIAEHIERRIDALPFFR